MIQEWIKETAQNQGQESTDSLISEVALPFTNISQVQKVVLRHVQFSLEKFIKNREFDRAEAKLALQSELISNKHANQRLVLKLYDNWSKSFSEQDNWRDSVDVYIRALDKHPKNPHLKKNAIAAWHAWAQLFMDKKQ